MTHSTTTTMIDVPVLSSSLLLSLSAAELGLPAAVVVGTGVREMGRSASAAVVGAVVAVVSPAVLGLVVVATRMLGAMVAEGKTEGVVAAVAGVSGSVGEGVVRGNPLGSVGSDVVGWEAVGGGPWVDGTAVEGDVVAPSCPCGAARQTNRMR